MIVAPAATPKPILYKLNGEIGAIIKDPAVAHDMTGRGFVPSAGGTPEKLAAFVKSEIDRWGKVVRQAGAGGVE